ncbi:MAG TPA: pantoate--beta-alanine ligase [Dissulfurispiraceae bacterium]|nr:pantoate--beta-alanine ligase [Dissulfurispiraceae bacterium]
MPRLMQETSKRHSFKGKTIGFVPTMGALHEGHLSLIKRAKSENDIVVVSIFVNSLQFGPGEDFYSYPRDIEKDTEKLTSSGVDVLFVPEHKNLYPEGFASHITIDGVSERLCGPFRPGHFSGVATVVAKLFNIVRPVRAYLGQKDFQQTVVINRLVEDLNMELEVVTCPTVRERDGLAMSSRNTYLSAAERVAATVLYKSLSHASQMIKTGAYGPEEVKSKLTALLKAEPLVSDIQYAGIYDPETLVELEGFKQQNLVAAAVKIGGTRLIDNELVNR